MGLRRGTALGLLGVVVAAPPAVGWEWELPPGFPVPRVPEDNPMSPAKVELGRFLFYDTRLSGNGSYACASCHRQELAFTDGRARALGSTGQLHPRSAMSLANAAYNVSYSWADAELRRLEDQARVPMFNEQPIELGLLGNETVMLDRLRAVERYRELFAEAFPDNPDPFDVNNVVRALASFERTLISGNSPYNRLVYHDEREALGESARRGMRLFFSERTHCSECHAGFNFSGPVTYEEAETIEPVFHNTGLYDIDGRGAYPAESRGLSGAFRAPTLLNIALTAPYMHDGSVATLEEVVEHYAAGGRLIENGVHAGDGRKNPYKSDRVTGLKLAEGEKRDLVEFLNSLTDEGFVTDPRFSDPWVPKPSPAHEPR